MDSSALVAGVISATGASRAILQLAEVNLISVTISEQVVVETERALARKAPKALPIYRAIVRDTGLKIVRNPHPAVVAGNQHMISDPTDVPILVAAIAAQTDYLVSLNRRHSLDDPNVAKQAGIRIGSPSAALAWLRERLSGEI